MNALDQAADHFTAEYHRVAAGLPGASLPWLVRLREEGLAAFRFPTPQDEDWKYTRTQVLARRGFVFDPEAGGTLDVARLDSLLPAEMPCHRVVFVNGRWRPELSDLSGLSGGVSVCGLAEALATRPDQVAATLGCIADARRHPFVALNNAFNADGVVIQVAPGVVLGMAIHVLLLVTPEHGGKVSHPRIVVDAGTRSEATLIETYAADSTVASWTNTVTEIRLQDKACLKHYRFEDESAKAFHTAGVHVDQARDSRYDACTFTAGGLLARSDVDVRLNAPGAECTLNGLYLAGGRQHMDHHTRVDHLQPHCRSNELYKGVLDGHGRGVFNGKTIVHPQAQKSDARQANHNLLLSEHAEADTRPELEIYADDVKCAHGATVGQLNGDALFYLRARGLSLDDARAALTYGFCREIVDTVELPALRDHWRKIVLARLPGEARIEEES
ncbi:MAG TPA: Fe-S cluster assembly protein SufD [Gammaproteobacteria bacterium]|nr:Fe-S cluster assembly protein SufD [Gammaproteobacteria bacterium]